MEKINFEDRFEIYLFKEDQRTHEASKLNEFICFLKYTKAQMPYKFSFSGSDAELLPELSLNENILLDFNSDSLTESKEVQFQDFLRKPENKHIEMLYRRLEHPHGQALLANAQMKKLCSLIKAFLTDGQFIFLERPERALSEEIFDLYQKALKFHQQTKKVNIFISTDDEKRWSIHANNLVERSPDYSFKISSLKKTLDWQQERAHFYKSKESKSNKNVLNFIIPAESSSSKKSVA